MHNQLNKRGDENIMQKKFVAILNIGSSKITALIGEQGVNNAFIIRGKGESEYAGFSDGEFFETDKLQMACGFALSKAEEQARMKIEALYVGVPAEFTFCDCTEVEASFKRRVKVNKNDISYLYSKALNKEVMKTKTLVSCNPIWFKFDDGRKTFVFEKQKTQYIKAKVSLIYVENSFISLFNEILGQLKIESVEYISSSYAQANNLLSAVEKHRGAVIIDVGYLTTSVFGVLGEGLAGLGAFSLGGAHISADLSEGFEISFYEAEMLKKEIALSVNSKKVGNYEVNIENQVLFVPVDSANEIVCERIKMISSCIKRCFQRLSEQNLENTQLYLTGGGLSYITGGKECLEKCLGREIQILSPRVPAYSKPELSSSISVLSEALKKQVKTLNWFTKLFI